MGPKETCSAKLALVTRSPRWKAGASRDRRGSRIGGTDTTATGTPLGDGPAQPKPYRWAAAWSEEHATSDRPPYRSCPSTPHRQAHASFVALRGHSTALLIAKARGPSRNHGRSQDVSARGGRYRRSSHAPTMSRAARRRTPTDGTDGMDGADIASYLPYRRAVGKGAECGLPHPTAARRPRPSGERASALASRALLPVC
jgi:hypothetical protein